jgi:hypothetical protein
MRNKIHRTVVAISSLLVIAVPAFAHHSFASEFDESKVFVIKGVLTKLDWSNPHVYIYVDVTDENNKVVTYTIQSGPPNMLHRAGIRQSDYKIGETVTITAASARDGSKHLGFFRMMKYPDGHYFVYRNGSE